MFHENEANEESLRGIPTECRFPSLIEEAPFDGEEHGGKGQNTFYWFFVNSKETLDKIQNTFYSNGVVAYDAPGLCSRKPYKLEESLIGQFICVEADCNGEEVWDPPVTLRTCLENVSNILSALGLTMSVTGIKKIKEENKLPEHCCGVNLSTRTPIIIRRNESGYYSMNVNPCNTIEEANSIADEYNKFNGITKAQRAAMEVGSMFGWDVPGADPDNYDEEGRPKH